MASYTKRKTKKGWVYRFYIKKGTTRKTATFDTVAEGKAWAAQQESELVIAPSVSGNVLLSTLFNKYEREVVPQHKGARWEKVRLNKLLREIGDHTIKDLIEKETLADWKNRKLLEVAPGTVAREMQLLNQVFNTAAGEWKAIPLNPLKVVKKPKTPKKRNRLIAADELVAICEQLNYSDTGVVLTKQQQVGLALHIALESAMRLGEILTLDSSCGVVVRLEGNEVKNGVARDVPMSKEARRLAGRIPKGGFTVGSDEASTLFGKARSRAGYPNSRNGGFRFHDSRANAITMLAKKLDILALAEMVGHEDLDSLKIYYRESAEDIAGRL